MQDIIIHVIMLFSTREKPMTFFENKNVYMGGQNISDKRFHLVMILPINSH